MGIIDTKVDKNLNSEAEESKTPQKEVHANYARAVLIGLLLVPMNAFWVMSCELRWHNLLTMNPLFVTPIFYLFALVTLNALLRRYWPKYTLQVHELVVIYVMLVVTCTVVSHDFLLNLLSSLPHSLRYARPENDWANTLLPHLPRWLFVWDKELVEGYFSGHSVFESPGVLKMWLMPLVFWTGFIFVIGWMMLCMMVIIRKAWIEDVKLSYPIARLPICLVESGTKESILRSKMLWLGVALAGIIDLSSGLNVWFPNLPVVTRSVMVAFRTPPWDAAASALYPQFLTIYPFSVGLAFLVPLEISFSCWFFYVFARLQSVIGYQMGYGNVADFPFETEQAIGAWVTMGVMLIYGIRRHLKEVFLQAIRPSKEKHGEMMSYRTAVGSLLVCSVIFVVFWSSAGMSLWLAVLALAAYLITAICITRIRAESGAQHAFGGLEPLSLVKFVGTDVLGPTNVVVAAVSHWYWRMGRSHMAPSFLEAMYISRKEKMNYRVLLVPIVIAILLATIFGMWTGLHIFYKDGALAKCLGFPEYVPIESTAYVGDALRHGVKPELWRFGGMGVGAVMVIFLSMMRMRFVGFPFHPLGYCVSAGLYWHWFPFFFAWLLKLIILRYGGLKIYSKAIPFFLGLVLGEYLVGGMWAAVGIIWNIPTYQIW